MRLLTGIMTLLLIPLTAVAAPAGGVVHAQPPIFAPDLKQLLAWSATDVRQALYEWTHVRRPNRRGEDEASAQPSSETDRLEGVPPSFPTGPWNWLEEAAQAQLDDSQQEMDLAEGLDFGDEGPMGVYSSGPRAGPGLLPHWKEGQIWAQTEIQGSVVGGRPVVFGPDPSLFREAEWVHREDMEKFEAYARQRLEHDRYRDYGKIRSRDLEYVYRIYIKGGAAPMLDTSESWRARALGGVIEQVDGISGLLQAFDEAFLQNNLFLPVNPIRKFRERFESSPAGIRLKSTRHEAGLQKVQLGWKWMGDLAVGVGAFSGGMEIEEVLLELGRLQFSQNLEVSFDLFYVSESEFSRTGSAE
ncbi:MAG: hypothetical protein HYU36_15355 [Planctomycetes bacterium]|nr:hypothetical protein [Planctomycetota bacterium]